MISFMNLNTILFFCYRNSVLSVELSKHRHNITVISPYSEPNPASGVHYILLENDDKTVNQKFVKAILEKTERTNPIYDAFLLQNSYFSMCSGKYVQLFHTIRL